ncbi:protein ERGIC-53-like isoform X6 [Cavia porcellus]|uniref:protein ERGIC-53-like isoform X6 n=1 Tax=Cavia porcellus TaxID=10141 RepID=UPI002FE0B36C
MPGAQGLDVLLCLLFLLLLAPHSIEGGSPPLPPQRRFEYKLSFKSPRLAWPGVGIPFWTHHGDAILGLEEVRLAPSLRNRSGAVWSRTLVSFPAWEVETQMRVTGPGRRGTQGMVVWYTLDGNLVGSVPRRLASRDGVGIFFNSSAEDTRNSPAIRVLASDGHSPHKQLGNGGSRVLGSCHWDFRNRPYPFRARITYWQQRLRVSLSSGFTPNDPEDICIDVGPLLLTPGGYFGVSAATGALAGLGQSQYLALWTANSASGPARHEGCCCSHGLGSPGCLSACGHQASLLGAGPDPGSPAQGPSGHTESSSQRPPEPWLAPRDSHMPAAWHLPALPPHPDCRLLLLCELQAEAGQETSGKLVPGEPLPGSCTRRPQYTGGPEEAALLLQCACLTHIQITFHGEASGTWGMDSLG